MPPELVYDVLIPIFERVYYTINYDLDRDSLINFAIVCKAWTLPAQRVLFRNVVIQYRDNYLSFDAATKADNEKHILLRESVQVLHVWLANGRLRMNTSELPTILERCPRLKDFKLTLGREVTTLASSPRGLERLRSAMPLSTIRAFQIAINGSQAGSNVLQQIFQILPPSALDFLAIGSQQTQINYIPELDPSVFDVLDYSCPWHGNPPSCDLPFDLSPTSFLPKRFATWFDSEGVYLPILRFLGPDLLSLTLPNVCWRYPSFLQAVTDAAPRLQHLLTIHSHAAHTEFAVRVEADVHVDRSGWIPLLTGWNRSELNDTDWGIHSPDWETGYRKEEYRLTARQAIAYGGVDAQYIWKLGIDKVREAVEEAKWRDDAVRKYWGAQPRPEFRHIVIAKRKRDIPLCD